MLSTYRLNSTITLKNRIVMAPMTRNMADDTLTPIVAMQDYYARRAKSGLIITEATIISADGRGHSNVPGIFTAAQIAGWQGITEKVHARGGKIFLQLWHVGRVTHPFYLNGARPISASATQMIGTIPRARHLHYARARALTLQEIQNLIDKYRQAAKNAMRAGFDGVEIHGANGYLLDQFLHHHTNHRTDSYGETPENMARFPLQVVSAIGDVIGYERVGLRLSPAGHMNEIANDDRDKFVFEYLLQSLNKLSIAYVHTGNFIDSVIYPSLNNKTMTAFMRQFFQGNLIASGSYDVTKATTAIANHEFDLIAFGRPFIANPDLIERIQNNLILKQYHVDMLTELQ